ncbi:hypothetical protein ACFO4E_18140 [Nocardiopsis mangrovi]|uniref:Uncharacterized protein n=1 Tax=Nocardiopsis mangrovi TaxID=1179818 RepID=A0ABV9DZQ1_9ACTN
MDGGGTALDWLVAILAGVAVPVLLILLIVGILTYGVRSAEREKAERDRAARKEREEEREPGDTREQGDRLPGPVSGDDDAPGGGRDDAPEGGRSEGRG